MESKVGRPFIRRPARDFASRVAASSGVIPGHCWVVQLRFFCCLAKPQRVLRHATVVSQIRLQRLSIMRRSPTGSFPGVRAPWVACVYGFSLRAEGEMMKRSGRSTSAPSCSAFRLPTAQAAFVGGCGWFALDAGALAGGRCGSETVKLLNGAPCRISLRTGSRDPARLARDHARHVVLSISLAAHSSLHLAWRY